MKYMVEIAVGVQSGNELEVRSGGPGPLIGRLLETFKPEVAYMATTERKMFLVVDLANDADTAALMIIAAKLGGAYPQFTPVISSKEFGGVVGPAIEKANKVVNG